VSSHRATPSRPVRTHSARAPASAFAAMSRLWPERKQIKSVRDRLKHAYYRILWRRSGCCFILSTGRVGTASLVRLLNRCPDVGAYHEPKPKCLEHMRRSYLLRHGFLRDARQLVARSRAALIAAEDAIGRVYVEATTLKFFAHLLAEMLPNAKFLHVHRHAGGVVRSAMRRRWFAGHQYDKYKIVPRDNDPAAARWSKWGPFEKNCWLWAAENQFFLDFGDVVGDERYMRVPYEKLFLSGSGIHRRLFEFVGGAPLSEQAIEDALAVRYNAQTKVTFLRYQDWPWELRETLQTIAGPTLANLGYEA